MQADPHGGLPVSADLLSLVNLEAFRRDYSSFLRDYSGFVGGGRGRFGLLLLREHPRHDAQLGGRCGWLDRQFLFRQLTKKPLYEGLLRDLRFQGLCGSSLGEFGAGDSLGSGENELLSGGGALGSSEEILEIFFSEPAGFPRRLCPARARLRSPLALPDFSSVRPSAALLRCAFGSLSFGSGTGGLTFDACNSLEFIDAYLRHFEPEARFGR